MRSTAQEVLDARKSGQEVRDHDLLAAMLKGIDPQTGQWVSYDSIINDLITFLVAGHDTTSGMLSDTFYHLLKNPETFATQKEVDPVCGKGPVTLAHISKLGYINGALREALRIDSTIPTIGLSRKADTTLGGKYYAKKINKLSHK
jgi:cytochrome P450/NADPH-cytochrome P450 reductase